MRHIWELAPKQAAELVESYLKQTNTATQTEFMGLVDRIIGDYRNPAVKHLVEKSVEPILNDMSFKNAAFNAKVWEPRQKKQAEREWQAIRTEALERIEALLAAAATNARREELEHVIYILHHTDGYMAKTAFHNQPAGIGREAYIDPFEFLCDCGGLEMREILQKRLAALDSHPEEAKSEYLTCSECGKSDDTVGERACGYSEEISGTEVMEVVCNDCEHEHLMDI